MVLTATSIHLQLHQKGELEPTWTMSSPLTTVQQGVGWPDSSDPIAMGRPLFSNRGLHDN